MMEGRVDRAEPDDQNTERTSWRRSLQTVGRSALLFGGLLCGCGWSVHLQAAETEDYDPWEEPWENSSSPVDLTLAQDKTKERILTSRLRTPQRTPPEFAHLAGRRVPCSSTRRLAYPQTAPSILRNFGHPRALCVSIYANAQQIDTLAQYAFGLRLHMRAEAESVIRMCKQVPFITYRANGCARCGRGSP